MNADRTLKDLFASGRDDAVAIAAHEAPPLTYEGLRALIERTVRNAERSRNWPWRSGRDRIAERTRNGDGVSVRGLRGDVGAAQSRL